MKYLTQREIYDNIFRSEKDFATFQGLSEEQANVHARNIAVSRTVAVWRKQYQTKATEEELHDNIDRPDRHNVAGPLNRPSEMQLAAYNKAKGYKS